MGRTQGSPLQKPSVFSVGAIHELPLQESFAALSKEKNPKNYYRGLLDLARDLEGEGEARLALELYEEIKTNAPTEKLKGEAERLQGEMLGKGGRFSRVEGILREIPKTTVDWGLAGTMLGAGFVNKLSRAGALRGFKSWTGLKEVIGGKGVIGLSRLVGFGAEGPAFAGFGMGIASLKDEPVDMSWRGFLAGTVSGYAFLGPVKTFGWVGRKGFDKFLRVDPRGPARADTWVRPYGNYPITEQIAQLGSFAKFTRGVNHQTWLFGGILAGHELEARAAGHDPLRGEAAFWEGLRTLTSLNVAGLGLRVLGAPLKPFEQKLEMEFYEYARRHDPLYLQAVNKFFPPVETPWWGVSAEPCLINVETPRWGVSPHRGVSTMAMMENKGGSQGEKTPPPSNPQKKIQNYVVQQAMQELQDKDTSQIVRLRFNAETGKLLSFHETRYAVIDARLEYRQDSQRWVITDETLQGMIRGYQFFTDPQRRAIFEGIMRLADTSQISKALEEVRAQRKRLEANKNKTHKESKTRLEGSGSMYAEKKNFSLRHLKPVRVYASMPGKEGPARLIPIPDPRGESMDKILKVVSHVREYLALIPADTPEGVKPRIIIEVELPIQDHPFRRDQFFNLEFLEESRKKAPSPAKKILTPEQPASDRVTHSPSGLVVYPENGADIFEVIQSILTSKEKIPNRRIILNIQHWSEPIQLTSIVKEHFQNFAEHYQTTLCLKTALPPYVYEFMPAAEAERQRKNGPYQVMGKRSPRPRVSTHEAKPSEPRGLDELKAKLLSGDLMMEPIKLEFEGESAYFVVLPATPETIMTPGRFIFPAQVVKVEPLYKRGRSLINATLEFNDPDHLPFEVFHTISVIENASKFPFIKGEKVLLIKTGGTMAAGKRLDNHEPPRPLGNAGNTLRLSPSLPFELTFEQEKIYTLKLNDLHRSFFLGRSRTADVRIQDESISGQHARIFRNFRGEVVIERISQTNPLLVFPLDGTRPFEVDLNQRTVLKNGQRFQIGNTQIQIKLPEGYLNQRITWRDVRLNGGSIFSNDEIDPNTPAGLHLKTDGSLLLVMPPAKETFPLGHSYQFTEALTEKGLEVLRKDGWVDYYHARIVRQPDGNFYLVNLSPDGTALLGKDGNKVFLSKPGEKILLHDREILEIGKTRITFREPWDKSWPEGLEFRNTRQVVGEITNGDSRR